MPFAQRIVEPAKYEIVPGSLKTDDPELIPVEISNRIIVTILEQMKCLVRHADDIFCDLTEECHKVVERTDKVKEKVKSLTETVDNLNYRTVPIPVGDLKVFCQKENGIDHFTAKHGYECLLLAVDTRPQCLKDLHNMAMVNPLEIIRRCDEYRRDGVKGSMLFKQWPVFDTKSKSKTPELSLRKLPPVITFEKEYKPLKLRNIVIKRADSSEKDEEAIKPDTAVIPIDTSGNTFQRMCSFRQSLRSVDGDDTLTRNVKKKRRQTFSGVPDNVWKEIRAFESKKIEENKRNSIQERLKSYSFDDLDAELSANDGELTKYLNQVEDRIEEREEHENSLAENKFLRLIPCRRSCSLPRSAKLQAARQRHLNSRPLSKCHQAKSETTLAHLMSSTGALSNKRSSSIGSTLSLQSAGSVASSRPSRSTKRSSFIGVKIKSLLNVGSKSSKDSLSRPKSLDIDALEVEAETASTASNLSRTPSMPEGIHHKVGPGSFYYFDNNSTLPKMLAKKYDFPWESLPKDWTTSVKLREISKRQTREDRNSSSGNWSGSSARQSMESERAKSISALSHRSLGTDSGRESPTPTADGTTTDTAGEAGDEGSLLTEDTDRTVFERKTRASRLDTEAWLKSLSIRAAARADSSSSSETINSITKMDVPPMEDFTGDILERYRLMDDDASSVYSLDQEGFYTSFHNDSGLRRSTTTLWEESEATSPVDGKANSIQSVSSNLSVDSVIRNPFLKTVPSPVIMRPPPKRQVSSGAESDGSAIFSLPAPTPQPSLNPTVDFSFSESDQEIIYARVKQKTRISTTMYPSLCDVSTSDSEEEGLQRKLGGMSKIHKHRPMFDPQSVKVVELSPVFESSFGAGKGNMLSNDFDFEDDSASRVLSTFSTGSEDSLENKKTIAEIPTTYASTQKTKTIGSDGSKKFSFQNFSSVSSLERRSSNSTIYQSKLKHAGSLDDSNLLGSSSEDTGIKKQVLFNSLPRHYHVYKRNNAAPENMNSWPRSHQPSSNSLTIAQPASGILKSTHKPSSVPKTPKTLNFAPVVNMFDPGTPETFQVFPTSTGESPVHEVSQYILPQTNSFTAADSDKPVNVEKPRPLSSGSESDFTQEIDLPDKYMPSLVVRPGKRPSSSGSDVSPYASSSLVRNMKHSATSSVRSGESGDLGVYRKTLINSPTVDSGIGSVGDLSPSTPTSSVGTDEDLEQKDPSKKTSSSSQDSVFSGSSVQQRTVQSKYSFLNGNSTENLVTPPEQKVFGGDFVANGGDLEFADDSSDSQTTPTRHALQQPMITYSNTATYMNAINRASQSDSKLMIHSNKDKSSFQSHNSFSSLPTSGLIRTESPQNKISSNTRVSPNSTRTSSYRNACVNSTRSPSYRVAQSNTPFGSKLGNGKAIPAPTFRSDSYRVACDDLVPPPVPEHKERTETLRSIEIPDSAARAQSYRVAIEEMEDPEIFEYKPVNKRAAITSLDQLLPKPAVNGSKGLKSPKQIKRSITESGLFARLRGKQDKSSSKLNSSAPGPLKSSYVPLILPNSQDNSKTKSATSSYRVKPKSSTYMNFDILSSVEEVREDSMHGSMESVKASSVSSIQSFQSGQSANSFLRRESPTNGLPDDLHPLVRQRIHHMPVKSKSQVIRPSNDSRRKSTGSTRVMGGPHMTNNYKSLLLDSSMETGV